MKCPLSFHTEISMVKSAKHQALECLGVECAWWDSEGMQCSVKTILQAVWSLERALEYVVRSLKK